jgi:hypothetical protein
LQLGGPVGAAIGAGAGFLAGLIGLFRKSATEKAREKIKALYQVDIQDKGILKQIVEMAKQSFGNNLDMAIRSPQVRELIELYAQTTGQKMPLNPNTPRAVSLTGMGGAVYQNPLYVNGSPYAMPSGLPTLGGGSIDRIPAGTSAPVTVVVSPQATVELWRTGTTQAIVQNPRAVAQSAATGQRSSTARRESAINILQPNLITG